MSRPPPLSIRVDQGSRVMLKEKITVQLAPGALSVACSVATKRFPVILPFIVAWTWIPSTTELPEAVKLAGTEYTNSEETKGGIRSSPDPAFLECESHALAVGSRMGIEINARIYGID